MELNLEISENLHKIIDQVKDEKILESVYAILEKQVKYTSDFKIIEAQKEDLVEKLKKGQTNFHSWEKAWETAQQEIDWSIYKSGRKEEVLGDLLDAYHWYKD